jgi:acetyl esterase/lipase
MTLWKLLAPLCCFLASGLAAAAQPPPAPPEPNPFFDVIRAVEFAKAGAVPLRMDLYVPSAGSEPRPVVLWIHGENATRYPTPAARLVGDGYVVASIDYRQGPQVGLAAQLADCKAAVRWLRAKASTYKVNPDRVGVWGAGSGGRLAALLGVTGGAKTLEGTLGNLEQSSRVQAVVDYFGLPAAAELSPAKHASKDAAPLLAVHGGADTVALPSASEALVSALRGAGADATLEIVAVARHDFKEVNNPRVAELAETFLDNRLRGGQHERAVMPRPPDDSWEDPITDEPPGTHYVLYPTPSRGPGKKASFLLYLPPDYPTARTRRYPVIYRLHGLTDTSRQQAWYVEMIDRAIREGRMPPTIVVFVQGLPRGWYVDSFDGKQPVETTVIKELIPYVDANYRTIATREGRAVEGFSMGGFGSLRLGFKYPDLFATVSSFAAALHTLAEMQEEDHRFPVVYGSPEYLEKVAPWTIVEQNAGQIRGRQLVRMMVGDADELFPNNRAFHERLTKLNIEHTFDVAPKVAHSDHDIILTLDYDVFPFWNKAFAKAR